MTIEREDTRLTAYALGELSEAEKAGFEVELENDADARRELAATQETLDVVRAELRRGNAPKLDDERRGAIEERIRKPSRWTPGGRPALGVAFIVAAAAALALVVGVSRKPETTASRGEDLPLAAPATPIAPLALEPESGEQAARGLKASRLRAPTSEVMPNDVRPFEGHLSEMWGEDVGERYDHVTDNPFVRVTDDPRSTFSIDVDTASYSLVRRHLLDQKVLPPPGAVRIEELVNYFDYAYPEPSGGRPFSVQTDVASAPWAPEHRLLRIGIKGKHVALPQIPGSNLVFLIDVSGTMADENKLPLLKRGFSLLAERLRDEDSVSIVVYAGSSGLVLAPTRGSNRRAILGALERLDAGGSTNGGEGIELAYREAREAFVPGGVNRVILATDGDFNVGVTNQDELVELVERQARSGVFLSVLGFGGGNYNDSMLEKLADKGNGNYAYIDDLAEARKVLVEQASGTLVTIAKDVKIQIEFNPAEVTSFRLLGYENRVLSHQDFNDDRKDAGEIGADHGVTALYEIVPAGRRTGSPDMDPLKYQASPERAAGGSSGELATIKLRYKTPQGSSSELIEVVARDEGTGIGRASSDFRFAAAVAELGMLLRNSPHKGRASYEELLNLATGAATDERRREFVRIARTAQSLSASR
jgi:Ca-activated chloride channel family protein